MHDEVVRAFFLVESLSTEKKSLYSRFVLDLKLFNYYCYLKFKSNKIIYTAVMFPIRFKFFLLFFF